MVKVGLRLMPTLGAKLGRIQRRFQNRLAEWHLAAVMTMLGTTLIYSEATFELAPFVGLQQMAPTWAWATILLGLGLIRLGVLVANGAIKRGAARYRMFMAIVASVVWFIFLWGLLAFETPLLIGSFLVGAIITEWVVAYRTAVDAGREEREAANGIV